MEPRTRYADNEGVSIAYQAFGEGETDLVLVPGFVSNIETNWDLPPVARMLERLASFSRLIVWDKRGTGCSDPVSSVPTVEERMEDLHAVLDDVGSESAVLLGISEGGPMSLVFAATYPERASALAVYGSTPKFVQAEDWEHGWDADLMAEISQAIIDDWGGTDLLALFAPDAYEDPMIQRAWGRFQRTGGSPAMARAMLDAAAELDIRPILPSVHVPTTVIHRDDDHIVMASAGRWMASQIPGARFVELEGSDHLFFSGDVGAIVDEVEEVVTGARSGGEPDRILATVLFTDIVSSTERAASLGDRRWREVLSQHDEVVRRQIARYRGRAVKSTGDGVLATFDGPARAIQCARAIHGAVQPLGFEIRAGLHTGECEVIGDDVAGMAVHIGARVGAEAAPGEVLVSGTVKDLVVGSGLEFADRGARELKGVPGEWRLYSVAG